MGKLIKNHWARLICLTAAAYQIAAALEAFFWPKFFFDFLTKNFDGAAKPVPALQTLNLVLGIMTLAYEWPFRPLIGTTLQRSLVARIFWLPLASMASILLYQSTNASLYYLIATIVYCWAYSEGEVICAVPWTLPKIVDRSQQEKTYV